MEDFEILSISSKQMASQTYEKLTLDILEKTLFDALKADIKKITMQNQKVYDREEVIRLDNLSSVLPHIFRLCKIHQMMS
jgi:hypothetical protein